MIPEVLRIERVFECVLSMVMIAMFLIIVKRYKKNILNFLVFTKACIRRRKKYAKTPLLGPLRQPDGLVRRWLLSRSVYV